MQAKLWIHNTTDNRLFARCKLSAGADFDWVEVTVRERDSAALALTMVPRVRRPRVAKRSSGARTTNSVRALQWNDLKVTALEVPDISNVFLGSN